MRTFSISSLFSQILMPGSNISLQYPSGQFILLEAPPSLLLQFDHLKYTQHCDEVILGKALHLKNTSTQMAKINGIVVTNNNEVDKLIKNRLIKKDSLKSILPLFRLPEQSPSRIDQSEEQLNLLFPSLLVSEEQRTVGTASPLKNSKKIDTRLIVVHRYIRQHFDQPLTLQVLAELIQCNPVYLSNTYSKTFRISPMKYIQSLRMKKASELLTTTELSVKEITSRLGYISNSQFSTIFKQYYACTPVEYRREFYFNQRESEVTI